jgi:DNA polymerase-1
VAIDTETSDLDAMRAELTGISLALGPNDAATSRSRTAAATCSPRKPVQVDKAAALSALKPLLESDAVLKVGQNIKYDINCSRGTASPSRRSTTR